MSSLDRVLIIGAGGIIGSCLNFGIKKSRQEIDVLNPEQLRNALDEINPSAIITLASVGLRDCEKDPLKAYNVNSWGVYNVALEAKRRNIPVIYISTGAVFNGEFKEEFNEQRIPQPRNVYGQTKTIAETMIKSVTDNYLIVRTGWLYGIPSEKKTGIDKLLNLIRENNPVTVTTDQTGSLAYWEDFRAAFEELISSGKRGIYHVANKGAVSAEDIAVAAKEITGSNSEINRVTLADFDDFKRSASESLASEKLDLPDWKASLERHLKAVREQT